MTLESADGDDGGAVAVVGAALVGVVACWLCGAADVVAAEDAGDELDGGFDGATDEVDADDGGADVAGDVELLDAEELDADELDGASVVVDVVGDGGALGVLVGSTAGTSAADDGGTV